MHIQIVQQWFTYIILLSESEHEPRLLRLKQLLLGGRSRRRYLSLYSTRAGRSHQCTPGSPSEPIGVPRSLWTHPAGDSESQEERSQLSESISAASRRLGGWRGVSVDCGRVEDAVVGSESESELCKELSMICGGTFCENVGYFPLKSGICYDYAR